MTNITETENQYADILYATSCVECQERRLDGRMNPEAVSFCNIQHQAKVSRQASPVSAIYKKRRTQSSEHTLRTSPDIDYLRS